MLGVTVRCGGCRYRCSGMYTMALWYGMINSLYQCVFFSIQDFNNNFMAQNATLPQFFNSMTYYYGCSVFVVGDGVEANAQRRRRLITGIQRRRRRCSIQRNNKLLSFPCWYHWTKCMECVLCIILIYIKNGSRHNMHSDLIFNINIMMTITIFMDNITFHRVFPWLGMHTATSVPMRFIIFWIMHAYHVFSSAVGTLFENTLNYASSERQ